MKSVNYRDLYTKLIEVSKASGKLPMETKFSKFEKQIPDFSQSMSNSSKNVENLLIKLLSVNNISVEKSNDGEDGSEVDLFNLYEKVVEFLNLNYTSIDRLVTASISKTGDKPASNTLQTLPKPQVQWAEKIDNSMGSCYVPKLLKKENNSVERNLNDSYKSQKYRNYQCPLDVVELFRSNPSLPGGPPQDDSLFNPYAPEIHEVEMTGVHKKLQISKPEKIKEENVHVIDTEEELDKLAFVLDTQSELYFHLFDHLYRSYQGFVSLLAVSVRDRGDYLIDTIKLRQNMHVLNAVFTNPRVLKVCRNLAHSVLALQRDFGIYVVNAVDLSLCAKMLKMKNTTLAYLVKYYLNLPSPNNLDDREVDNKIDWRIRPLPDTMKALATFQAHYLEAVFNKIKFDLMENEARTSFRDVYLEAKKFTLLHYEKRTVMESDYLFIKSKFKIVFSGPRRELVFKQLFMLRDRIARRNDESVEYVLGDFFLVQILKNLPEDEDELKKCFVKDPAQFNYCVRENVREILAIVLESEKHGDVEEQRNIVSLQEFNDLGADKGVVYGGFGLGEMLGDGAKEDEDEDEEVEDRKTSSMFSLFSHKLMSNQDEILRQDRESAQEMSDILVGYFNTGKELFGTLDERDNSDLEKIGIPNQMDLREMELEEDMKKKKKKVLDPQSVIERYK